jgi:acyl carrier protein
MKKMSVLDEIRALVSKNLGVDEAQVKAESNLVADLGADSLDAVELIMEIEDHFDISINEEDAQNLETVQDIIDYIEK